MRGDGVTDAVQREQSPTGAASPADGPLAGEGEVLFERDGMQVTTQRVVMNGKSWGLEHVCGVTVLFQRPTARSMRGVALFAGALMLIDLLVQGPLAAARSNGSVGGVVFSVAALVGYAALAWRVLHAEHVYIWLHTRFSSQMVYRGRSSEMTRALTHSLRTVVRTGPRQGVI
ncbi:hypothetical protein A176_002648 [Myxococcus hansupus]|uniref:Uncharacterized protein n=2 Tax=Pseudomyxococcus hansupus TaxID=1297742 RepID=A0A0H4WQD3_9BACT|nr:hypothetical protein A176_002648 [Myxococcus hansupus]